MSKQKARVAITRRGGVQGEGYIAIAITDDSSGLLVCEVEMSLSDFAECVTGLAGSNAEFRAMPSAFAANRYGKTKVVERVSCPKEGDKKDMVKNVRNHFDENYGDEWELWSDGTTTKQNGRQHQYIICKYV